MRFPALWKDCIKKCSYGINREGCLRGLRRVIVFFYGSVFMLIIEDVEGVCTLRVVTFDVAGVFFIALF